MNMPVLLMSIVLVRSSSYLSLKNYSEISTETSASCRLVHNKPTEASSLIYCVLIHEYACFVNVYYFGKVFQLSEPEKVVRNFIRNVGVL